MVSFIDRQMKGEVSHLGRHYYETICFRIPGVSRLRNDLVIGLGYKVYRLFKSTNRPRNAIIDVEERSGLVLIILVIKDPWNSKKVRIIISAIIKDPWNLKKFLTLI